MAIKKNDINLFKASTVVKGKGSKSSPTRILGIVIIVVFLGVVGFIGYNYYLCMQLEDTIAEYESKVVEIKDIAQSSFAISGQFKEVRDNVAQAEAITAYINNLSTNVFLKLSEEADVAVKALFLTPDEVQGQDDEPKQFTLDIYDESSMKYFNDSLFINAGIVPDATADIDGLVDKLYELNITSERFEKAEAITYVAERDADENVSNYLIRIKLRSVFEYVFNVMDKVSGRIADAKPDVAPHIYIIENMEMDVLNGIVSFLVKIPSHHNWNEYVDGFEATGVFKIPDAYDSTFITREIDLSSEDFNISEYVESASSTFTFKEYDVEFEIANVYVREM